MIKNPYFPQLHPPIPTLNSFSQKQPSTTPTQVKVNNETSCSQPSTSNNNNNNNNNNDNNNINNNTTNNLRKLERRKFLSNNLVSTTFMNI